MNEIYHRAGIIPVIKYNDKLAVILFKQYTKYCDGGGGINKDEFDSKITACRELQEESKNLFNLSPECLNNGIKYIRNNNKKICVMYFIGINNNICMDWYYHNNNIIKNIENVSVHWFETHDVDIFYLDEIFTNMNIISRNTLFYIKNGLIGNEDRLNFIDLLECENVMSLDFLNGTKTYYK